MRGVVVDVIVKTRLPWLPEVPTTGQQGYAEMSSRDTQKWLEDEARKFSTIIREAGLSTQ